MSQSDITENESRKRPSDGEHEEAISPKRQRTNESESRPVTPVEVVPATTKLKHEVVSQPTADDFGRQGLKISIALALEHIGFESATKEALESFTETVDTYITDFVVSLRRVANAARRNDPIPEDYELILRQHNITTSSLKPHLKNPVPKKRLTPSFYNPITEDLGHLLKPRPFLGEELSGEKEKEERSYIPKDFPPLPPPHAYKFTPLQKEPDIKKEQVQAEADLKKGELALRRINRAARISRQKELKAAALRDSMSKQRHEAWEGMMTNMLRQAGSSSGAVEIADHSAIVDFGTRYGRKGVPKNARRPQADIPNGVV
ncbi:uncharacterized protein F4822DRAFT_195810 [Hypoxylon trugodes]|uniref:uncharacterized protein n=1 Tax=Hypoxylon trugodes TaxID=326681 RepID=UPI00219F70C1|nr:uncharacterized protein F4822DRAFT_195810 [Hypoxylon trugodes]KAI1389287.1 hypothetical protein F4822DRAFT_195810 [Hypoxylon trugodes]